MQGSRFNGLVKKNVSLQHVTLNFRLGDCMLLDCVVQGPEKNAKMSMIWMHGLGGNGQDLASALVQLQFRDRAKTRLIFPTAPLKKISAYENEMLNAWYDIEQFNTLNRDDCPGTEESRHMIDALIQKEIEHGVPSTSIFLGGFSQGGAMALYTGLRHPKSLAGLVVLSAYLSCASHLEVEKSATNNAIPIFMGHGSHDAIVTHHFGEQSRQRLERLGYVVDWHTYSGMEHMLCTKEMNDLSSWIERQTIKKHVSI